MTKIYLIRHAEAEGNISRTFHGQHDSDVTKNGEGQLDHLRRRFEGVPIDAIYSSDLIRAKKTAEAVKGSRDIDIRLDKRLREIDGGKWEQRSWHEIMNEFSDYYSRWEKEPHLYEMPDGESMTALRQRMVKAITDIAKENPGKTVCVASHGTAIKAFMTAAKGWELERFNDIAWYDNTAVTELVFDDGGVIKVISENDFSHLPDEMSTLSKQKWWLPKGEE